ncbi:hypothetical protein GP486_004485 [Trichoglossum hirsutum]|uniref:Uncharacterized protein n=1 Tax=Trichoglossum hirsutum TaxID=265104 RepID=A0A9P8RP14_9PEZI|nr:hypothetical protein GP486_004485 [Trichoglossum hirsutum]
MPVSIQEISLAGSFFSFQAAADMALGGGALYDIDSDIVLYQGGCVLADGTNNCTAACLNESLALRNLSSIQNCMVESNGTGCFPDICYFIDASVNPDVGGIGTFISYFMQIAIALAAWTVLRFFDTWTRNVIFCFMCPFGFSRAKQKAVSCQKMLRGNRQHAALKTALVEFHKAQCYFMLALQIAALVALGDGFKVLESKNYQQLYNNIALVSDVSIGGLLLATFVLFCLHCEGMKSWYAFTLSTSTVFASIATFIKVSGFRASIDDVQNPGNFGSCGGNPSPTKYCLESYSYGDDYYQYLTPTDSAFSKSVLICSLVVLALLFVDQCELFRPRDDNDSGSRDINDKPPRVNSYEYLKVWIKDWPIWRRPEPPAFLKWIRLDTAERVIRSGTATLVLAIEIYYLTLFSALLTNLWQIFSNNSTSTTTSSWSFGQIIAVTIWVPSTVEYIYLMSRRSPAVSSPEAVARPMT